MASSAAPSPRPTLLVPKPDPDLCAALRRECTIKRHRDVVAPTQAEARTPLTAENLAAWRRELEPSPDDHTDFAHRLRQTQRHLDELSARLSSAPVSLPPPPPPPPPLSPSVDPKPRVASSASTRGRNKKKRSRSRGTPGAEMVRATVTAEADLLLVRTAARRARLTFEALRGLYHRRALTSAEPSRAGRNRADMRALTAMLSRSDLCLFRDKRIVGAVPGVFVGDVFSYRAELIVVGLHNHTQGGIGYVPASLVGEGHPVATSIVSSGGYIDDRDDGDLLVYTGSGGRPRNGGAHHADQEFERGNLALAYSCKYGVEVRVIRCHDCDGSPSGKVYVYDGLYKVQFSTYEPGESGREVCKFNLVRLPGQEQRGSSVWLAARELADKLDANVRPPGYVTLDMSKGKEAVRVPVCNSVDQDRSPLEAQYMAERPRSTAEPLPPTLASRRRHWCCNYSSTACGGLSGSCACVKRNGAGVGPAYNADGTLVRGMPVVYECGARCGCPASCPNRATQRRMRHRLEVFRSKDTEWGVRTLDLIQPGAFICEFTGDLVVVEDQDDLYVGNADAWCGFVDPRKFPARWREWGDASAADDDEEGPPQFPECPTPRYVLDVSRRRNLAAYICHSAAPNAFVQFVVRGDEDVSCSHLMVFAMETIPPMRELSIDYGIAS